MVPCTGCPVYFKIIDWLVVRNSLNIHMRKLSHPLYKQLLTTVGIRPCTYSTYIDRAYTKGICENTDSRTRITACSAIETFKNKRSQCASNALKSLKFLGTQKNRTFSKSPSMERYRNATIAHECIHFLAGCGVMDCKMGLGIKKRRLHFSPGDNARAFFSPSIISIDTAICEIDGSV